MAGPQNNFNAAKQNTTVFSPDGEPYETNRPNAIDLVRTAGYAWKLEDVGLTRTEEDGPVDAAANIVVIYDADGGTLEVDRPNARELVASGKYTWNAKRSTMSEGDAAQAVMDAAEAVAATEKKIADNAPETAPENESLTDEAMRVAGEADLAKYLNGFSLEALKQIAEERYGEKIHHRASSETAIEKIIALEEIAQQAG